MSSNGVAMPSPSTLQWKVGMVNSQCKYLTAETFGFKINASSTTMRKKQMWTIEHDEKDEEVVYIRSHLGRYLTADKKGNVTCSAEERADDFSRFTIQYHTDGSGKWAFRNKGNGYYFGGSEDNLRCYEKAAGAGEYWVIRLDVHPQLNMRNVNRKRYVHLSTESGKLHCDELIPWGDDALITLEFRSGKYAVRSCRGQYLHRGGELQDDCSDDCLFTLEVRSGVMAGMSLKDCKGLYVSTVGKDGVVQSGKKTVSKDEVFTLEDSHPQVFITAHNGKMVSIKQGVDLSANQDELSDKETFQMEFDRATKGWRIRTCVNKFWSLEQASGIQGVGNNSSATSVFRLEYLDDGAVAILASNDRYLTARMNGSLYADRDSASSDKERFVITVVNRPLLILKCDYGFVGQKSASNPRVECNKVTYDIIVMEHRNGEGAEYYFKGSNGKYWSVDGEGMINAESDTPQPFFCEMRQLSRFVIRTANGMYIRGEQNGIMAAKADLQKATHWEY